MAVAKHHSLVLPEGLLFQVRRVAMPDLPTGTVTFLFTDIEGSTTRWEHHPQVMKAAVERHDGILRGAIETYGGLVFRTEGDAFRAAFTTASQALKAAMDAQSALYADQWDSAVATIRARIA